MPHVDAHFARGRTHAVCQDYTAMGPGVAVICDGCSGAPHSDVGARLLAHAAVTAHADALADGSWLAAPDAARRSLGLPEACLDATCIVARAHEDSIAVTMLGDGVVAARTHDDALIVIEVSFPDCAPPYPSYTLDPLRRAAYAEAGLGIPAIEASPDAPVARHSPGLLCWTFPRAQWASVLIGSDGLSAFRCADQSVAPTAAVVDALFRYPSPHGAFVTRRLRRYLAKQAPAAGLTPEDDVALAALCWETR